MPNPSTEYLASGAANRLLDIMLENALGIVIVRLLDINDAKIDHCDRFLTTPYDKSTTHFQISEVVGLTFKD